MRKRSTGRRWATLFLAPLVVLLLGCPKEPPPLDVTRTDVTTAVEPAKPGIPGATREPLPPVTRKIPDTATRDAQDKALKGEDIPLTDNPRQPFVDPTPQEREILRTIFFDYDQSEIRSEYRPVLEGIARWMQTNAGRQLLVEGHCDERGANEYNLALGERRALSIRRYLVGLGTSPDRIATISYGEEKPSDPGHAEANWAKNRRAEFKTTAPE